MTMIYKLCAGALWQQAQQKGVFDGAPVDFADGYIHFSTQPQIYETAAKHFAGERGLVVIAVQDEQLGDALKWEPSRGGDLFPHLYGVLDIGLVDWVKPLPLLDNGLHDFSSIFLSPPLSTP